MWVAAVTKPACPPASIHQHLWGYYPGMPDAERPFLYRSLGETMLLLSRVKPACPATHIADRIQAGRVYQFDVLASPRNGKSHKNHTENKYTFLRGNDRIRQWFGRRLHGAEATFVQVFDRPDVVFKHSRGRQICRPACIIRGTVSVLDRAEFIATLLRGIGGGGVWGFGLMVLPEVMACSHS